MFTSLRAIFRTEVSKLGRWEHRNNNKVKILKMTLANHDHCGDTICSKPLFIKNILDKSSLLETKKDTNKNLL